MQFHSPWTWEKKHNVISWGGGLWVKFSFYFIFSEYYYDICVMEKNNYLLSQWTKVCNWKYSARETYFLYWFENERKLCLSQMTQGKFHLLHEVPLLNISVPPQDPAHWCVSLLVTQEISLEMKSMVIASNNDSSFHCGVSTRSLHWREQHYSHHL